jgi:hypothetical protein
MIRSNRWIASTILLGFAVALVAAPPPGEWTNAVEVRHDDNLCVSYQARLDGPFLVVRATLGSGWHTFSMDNKVRAEKELGGRKSLGIDHPTEIVLTGSLEPVAPWYQSPPKDFSHRELRWFSWGFEQQALFVTKIHRSGAGPVRMTIKGQACTDSTCKNIDVAMSFPLGAATTGPADIDLKNLVQVQ